MGGSLFDPLDNLGHCPLRGLEVKLGLDHPVAPLALLAKLLDDDDLAALLALVEAVPDLGVARRGAPGLGLALGIWAVEPPEHGMGRHFPGLEVSPLRDGEPRRVSQ